MEDIYTKQRIVVPSDEHVLPNALGGRLISKRLIDKTTNERFGSSIDAALARDLLLVRVLLGALSGDKKLPPALRGAVGPDGAKYNLHPNEDAEVGKPWARVTESEGTVQIEGSARSAKELKALLGRPLAKANVPISVLDESMRATRTPAPPMKIELSIGVDAVRSIVKMAANLLAYAHREVALEAGFDPLRRYVLGGEETANLAYFNTRPVDLFAHRQAMGDLDHVIVVRRHANGEVFALVALYAHLQWVMRLGRSHGAMRRTTYRVDQMGRGTRLNSPLDARIQIPSFGKVAADSRGRHFEAREAAMRHMLRKVYDIYDNNYQLRLIREGMQEAIGHWGNLNHENAPAVSRAIGERWARYAIDSGRLRPELRPSYNIRFIK